MKDLFSQISGITVVGNRANKTERQNQCEGKHSSRFQNEQRRIFIVVVGVKEIQFTKKNKFKDGVNSNKSLVCDLSVTFTLFFIYMPTVAMEQLKF